ncbi:DUF4296 domain-containing protein [Mucilaginibacter litoreus]|uniref:DUF4296 domain-containing protein n=1 Tax=Mucilaginibacter litoreus TaxID=1048221 RepID=A0ABW3ASZ7_9SPHI
MQKYIGLFFSVLLYLTACKNDKVPTGIIEEQTMIRLLTDIHVVDGSIATVPQIPDSLYKYGRNKYVAVFKRYNTNDTQFKKSLEYYSAQPEKIQQMYDKIEVVLKAKVDSVNKVPEKKIQNAVPKQ